MISTPSAPAPSTRLAAVHYLCAALAGATFTAGILAWRPPAVVVIERPASPMPPIVAGPANAPGPENPKINRIVSTPLD